MATNKPSTHASKQSTATLDPVKSRAGRPLYKIVKQALVDAIESGVFKPNDRLPSTKELSRQMAVSLVTAHRALQELVQSGVLERTQGRGTFVIEHSQRVAPRYKLSVVIRPEVAMTDYYHAELFEGMRQAAQDNQVELVLGRLSGEHTAGSDGFMVVNPTTPDLEAIHEKINREQAVMVVGARSTLKGVASFGVDNYEMARQAVEHLHRLGHHRIAYIGGSRKMSVGCDRRDGFITACREAGLSEGDCPVIEATDWKLSKREKIALSKALNGRSRPTAVFAGGYYLSLDAYNVASSMGLSIPEDLSVIGIDDPPSASHLAPGLTTFAQPLVEVGHQAVHAMVEYLLRDGELPPDHILRAELRLRASTSAPSASRK